MSTFHITNTHFSRFAKLLSMLLLMAACTEKGPDIQLTDQKQAFRDSTYVASDIESPQDKNVVLEEFTGVRCVNCPEADSLIQSLLKSRDDLIVLSYHNSGFARPYGDDRDLRCEEAGKLDEFLGPVSGRPSGTVDRTLFNGENDLMLETGKWANYISQRSQESSSVNISLKTRFANDTRKLSVEATIHYTASEDQPNRLTVGIVENGIQTTQLKSNGEKDTAYIQEHALLGTITPYKGTPLDAELERGRTFIKSFQQQFPEKWNVSNCQVVAFVARSGSSKSILHGIKKNIQ